MNSTAYRNQVKFKFCYRRDQDNYQPGDGTDPNELVGGLIFTDNPMVASRWISRLRKIGFTWFVEHKDVNGSCSVSFCNRAVV